MLYAVNSCSGLFCLRPCEYILLLKATGMAHWYVLKCGRSIVALNSTDISITRQSWWLQEGWVLNCIVVFILIRFIHKSLLIKLNGSR